MAEHPKRFREDDAVLARVRELALAFPGADEKVSHGRPAFFTTQVFAYYGGTVRMADGEHVEHGQSILITPDEAERRALLGEERGFFPAYVGPRGWVGVDLGEDDDWDEVGELLEASYRETAPASLIRELGAR